MPYKKHTMKKLPSWKFIGRARRWSGMPQDVQDEPSVLFTPPHSSLPRHVRRPQPRVMLHAVYWLSKLAGIVPCKYDVIAERLVYSKYSIAYCVAALIFLFIQCSYMTTDIHLHYVQEGNIMSGLEPIIQTVLNSCLMAVSALRSRHLMDVTSTLTTLDTELTPRGPGPTLLPCLLPSLMAFIVSTADIVTSLADSSSLIDTLVYSPYYWGVIGGALVETQFNAACFALRYWFWILNGTLKRLRSRAVGAELRIEALRLTHKNLCNAAAQLEQAFGPQLLISCALCFSGIVLNAYFGVNGFYDSENDGSATVLMQQIQWCWAFLYLCRVSSTCFAATRLAAEAIQTGRTVHFLNDIRLPSKVKEEISIFSMQVSTSKLEFTAWGIVIIDFSLLFGIVSSTTTYLLILIQYRPK